MPPVLPGTLHASGENLVLRVLTCACSHPPRQEKFFPSEQTPGLLGEDLCGWARAGGAGDVGARRENLGGAAAAVILRHDPMPRPRPRRQPECGWRGARSRGTATGAARPVWASVWAPNTRMHSGPGDSTEFTVGEGQ